MEEPGRLVAEEVVATLDRADFEALSPDAFRIEVTDTLQRRLGDCRPLQGSDDAPARYRLRIARRLFEDDRDVDWRDTVRHEVAHAYVFATAGRDATPHGAAWKAAARRAGADPTARYEGDGAVDAAYVLACPAGCFERGYLKRSGRIKHPWRYACDECETALVSYDADAVPASFEPGTCYVASIPWDSEADQGAADRTQAGSYLLACPSGCLEWAYQQRSKRVKNPWLYTCPECDARLVSCDATASPTAFEPGTCNVASIPWTGPRIVHACPAGCFSVGHAEHTEETRQPGEFRCEDCGRQTVSYPAGRRPEEPSPGTNYAE